MGDLSERQFKAMLRRAIAEQSRDHTFSEADLVEAGEELGLDRAVVTRILDEHRSRQPAKALAQPRGTKIGLRSDGADLILEIPPAKGRGPGIGIIAGTIFGWIVLPLWTFGALSQDPRALPIALPSWIGLCLVSLKAISLWFKRTTLRFCADGAAIVERIGPIKYRTQFDVDDIQVRLNDGMGSFFRGRRHAFPYVEIRSGVKRKGLLQGFTGAEQEWVKSEIEAWIADMK